MPLLDDAHLLRLVDKIYDAALDPGRWPVFLDAFSDTFRGSGTLFSQDMRSADAGVAVASRFDPDFVRSYVEHYSATNVWMQSVSAAPAGTLVVGQRMVDTSTLEHTEFYDDWLRPQNLYETTGTILLKDGAVATNISIIRPRDPGTFDQRELQFWDRLMPHVRRAIQVHRELFSVRLQRDGALQGLDGLAVGVMLVASDGRLLFVNRVAERILRSGQGLAMTQGKIGGETAGASTALWRLVAGAVATGAGRGAHPGGVLALPRQSGGTLSVLVSPLRTETAPFGLSVPAALIFCNDPASKTSVGPAEIARLYGLTAAEARLLAALLAGARLAEYAEAEEITLNTAKTHLKQVFAKTGQTRQSDLVRHVLADPVVALAGSRS